MNVELTDLEQAFEDRLRTTFRPVCPRTDIWASISENLPLLTGDEKFDLDMEHDLHQLRPVAMADAQKARLLGSIQDPVENALQSMTPASPRVDLWDRIEAEINAGKTEPDKILAFPRARELAPLFKVAAIMVLFLGLLSLWYEPTKSTTTRNIVETRPPADLVEPIEQRRPVRFGSSPISPVSQGAQVQDYQNNVIYRNDKPYRSVRMRMTDTYFFKGANGERLEIKVPREEELILPVRTF